MSSRLEHEATAHCLILNDCSLQKSQPRTEFPPSIGSNFPKWGAPRMGESLRLFRCAAFFLCGADLNLVAPLLAVFCDPSSAVAAFHADAPAGPQRADWRPEARAAGFHDHDTPERIWRARSGGGYALQRRRKRPVACQCPSTALPSRQSLRQQRKTSQGSLAGI
jgi:hypothetical protein